MELPIKPNMDHLANRLYVPHVQPYEETATGQCVLLDVDPAAALLPIPPKPLKSSAAVHKAVFTETEPEQHSKRTYQNQVWNS